MTRIVLFLMVAQVPAAARAVDWSARAGVVYARTEVWSADQERYIYPRFDLDLSLDARGFFYEPGVFDWSGSAQYHRTTTSKDATDTRRDNLDFRGRAAMFRRPGSPVELTLFAQRRTNDYSGAGPAGEAKLTELTVGGDARLLLANRPTLDVGYSRTGQEAVGAFFGGANRTIQSLTAATTMGPGPYSVTATYAGNFSDGTYATDNFNDHRASIDAKATIDPRTTAQVSDSYYLRVPTYSAGVNPHQEYNFVSGMVSRVGEGFGQQHVSYRYSHALQTEGLSPDTERTQQRLEYMRQFGWGKEWRLRAKADVALGQDRLGGVEARSTGETLGAVLHWYSTGEARSLELRGGPSVALLQPSEGDNYVGYGATAGAAWARQWAPLSVRLQYDIGYGSSLHAVQGWTLTQLATGSLDRRLYGGILTAVARVQTSAFDNPTVGTAASRQIEAGGRYQWGTFSSSARLVLASNMQGSMNESLASDGLFIPPGYDSHSRSLVLGAAANLYRHVNLSFDFRYTDVVLPDRPSRDEVEVRGKFEWGYGALRIAIEDRYMRATEGGNTAARNLVMLNFYRAFGSRD